MSQDYTVKPRGGHRPQVTIFENKCVDLACPRLDVHSHLSAYCFGLVSKSQVGYMADLLRSMGESGDVEISMESAAFYDREKLDFNVVRVIR